MYCNLRTKPNFNARYPSRLKEKDLASVTYMTLSNQAIDRDEF